MEMNRRRSRGLVKGKLLMPFYKGMKAAASSNVNNVHYTCSTTTSSYVRQHPAMYQSKTEAGADSEKKLNVLTQKLFGKADDDDEDESVDVRAATYISSVQQRFKLERLNSDRVTVLSLDTNDDL